LEQPIVIIFNIDTGIESIKKSPFTLCRKEGFVAHLAKNTKGKVCFPLPLPYQAWPDTVGACPLRVRLTISIILSFAANFSF
jgi:hypothetical protein